MKKKILHIDMDGVLADFEGYIKSKVPGITWEDSQVDNYCASNPRIFKDLPEIKDAILSVTILKAYYEIYFLSTPMWDLPYSYKDKRLWIHAKFGDWSKNRLILTKHKDLIIGDYLVDDRTANGADMFQGEHLHFGTELYPDWQTTLNSLITKYNIDNGANKRIG